MNIYTILAGGTAKRGGNVKIKQKLEKMPIIKKICKLDKRFPNFSKKTHWGIL